MITKKIHYCWLSNDPLPELTQRCLASWKRKLPNYEIILWDLNKFDINSCLWTKECFETKKYAFAADYIRLYALYTEGGIYLDSDVEVIRSFDPFLNYKSFIGFETSGDIEPAIIGTEPGTLWIEECLNHYKDRHFIKPDNSFDTKPLPLIVEKELKKTLNIKNFNRTKIFKDDKISIYPSEYFSPKSFHTKDIYITSNTVCIHHFDGSWIKSNFANKIKIILHQFIIRVVGRNNHKKIVNLIRKIIKK